MRILKFVSPVLACAAVFAATPAAIALDGTYTSQTGAWNDVGSWSGGTIASGADFTAFFTNNVTTSNRTTSLGVNRTIGHIVFTDGGTSDFNRTLSNNILTLDVTTGAPTIDVTQAARILTISSQVSGNDGLTKIGDGLLILGNNSNNFTGKILVSGGRLRADVASRLGANPVAFTPDQITLDGGTFYGTNVSGFGNRGFTLGAGGGSFLGNNDSSMTIDVAIAGTGGLTKSSFTGGNFTLTLSEANTYSGATLINANGGVNASNLVIGHVNALQNSHIDTSATTPGTALRGFRLDYGTNTDLNIGGLTGSVNLADVFDTNDGNYGTVNAITLNTVAGKDISYSGAIGGGRSLTKSGIGTQTLTGALAYTGTTAINAGTLVVNGTHTGGGTYTIAAGASLGGTGSIDAAMNVFGAIAPGNSIGTLDSGTVTWNGAGSQSSATDWVFELGPGNTADLLNITGDFLNGGGSVFNFDFAGSTATGTFNLVTWSGSTNFAAIDFSFTNLGSSDPGNGFLITGNTLQFIAVPEPGAMLLAGIGVAGLAVAFRRLRRKA